MSSELVETKKALEEMQKELHMKSAALESLRLAKQVEYLKIYIFQQIF